MADKDRDAKAKSQADKKAGEKYQEKLARSNKDDRRDKNANQSGAAPTDKE